MSQDANEEVQQIPSVEISDEKVEGETVGVETVGGEASGDEVAEEVPSTGKVSEQEIGSAQTRDLSGLPQTLEEFFQYEGITEWPKPVIFPESAELSFMKNLTPKMIKQDSKDIMALDYKFHKKIILRYDKTDEKVQALYRDVNADVFEKVWTTGKSDEFRAYIKPTTPQVPMEDISGMNAEAVDYNTFINNGCCLPIPLSVDLLLLYSMEIFNYTGQDRIRMKAVLSSTKSVDFFQSAFWWLYLEFLNPLADNSARLKDYLIHRLADLFYRLIVDYDLLHQPQKKDFLLTFADLYSQALYLALSEAFQYGSEKDEELKYSISSTMGVWVYGMKPLLGAYKHWNLNSIMHKYIQNCIPGQQTFFTSRYQPNLRVKESSKTTGHSSARYSRFIESKKQLKRIVSSSAPPQIIASDRTDTKKKTVKHSTGVDSSGPGKMKTPTKRSSSKNKNPVSVSSSDHCRDDPGTWSAVREMPGKVVYEKETISTKNIGYLLSLQLQNNKLMTGLAGNKMLSRTVYSVGKGTEKTPPSEALSPSKSKKPQKQLKIDMDEIFGNIEPTPYSAQLSPVARKPSSHAHVSSARSSETTVTIESRDKLGTESEEQTVEGTEILEPLPECLEANVHQTASVSTLEKIYNIQKLRKKLIISNKEYKYFTYE